MKLPVLQDPRPGEMVQPTHCTDGAGCATCSLFKRRCEGCTVRHRAGFKGAWSNFGSCYQTCNECTGFKVRVPAICCRSPLKDVYLTAVTKGAADYNEPKYTYTERPQIDFKNKAVFYISSGGVNTITSGGRDLVPPGTEVVAVNLPRVWGSNGFFSQDLKDYLHLPAKTKLILITMCMDDLLERAWNAELYDPTALQTVGLDHWMPLSFSAYPEEAHMHQYYQTLRTLYCTDKSAAWFVTGDHFLTGLKTDDLILDAVKRIPQMVFNTQFVGKNLNNLKYSMRVLKHYHELVPSGVPFWLVGTVSPTFVTNARRHCGARTLYFLSPRPLYLAAKGRELLVDSRDAVSKLPKLELLHHNYGIFSQVVTEYA